MYVVCIWRKIVIFSKQTVFVQVRGGVCSSQPQHWIYKPFVRNKLFLVSQIASFRKRPRNEHELKTTEHWASSQNKVRVKRKGREIIAYLLSCSDTISIAVVVTTNTFQTRGKDVFNKTTHHCMATVYLTTQRPEMNKKKVVIGSYKNPQIFIMHVPVVSNRFMMD